MPVYGEDGHPPRFVDGDLLTAIIFITLTRSIKRPGSIITAQMINALFIDGCDPF